METDFFSSSDAVSFTNGQTTANAVLLLRNDAVPEGNETFIVEITGETPKKHSKMFYLRFCIIKSLFWLAGTRFGAEIGSVSRLVLIVRANDDPYGEFQFSMVS